MRVTGPASSSPGRPCGPTTSVREIGSAGGLVVERHDAPRVLICFPGYSGEFAGAANAGELARALARFSTALGFGYAYSAASTVHKLIERCQPRGHGLGPPAPHPALEPPYLPTAWSVPAAAWSRALTERRTRPALAGGRRPVRLLPLGLALLPVGCRVLVPRTRTGSSNRGLSRGVLAATGWSSTLRSLPWYPGHCQTHSAGTVRAPVPWSG